MDNKTISKWARALRYVAHCKKPRTPLKRFMKKMGALMRVLTGMGSSSAEAGVENGLGLSVLAGTRSDTRCLVERSGFARGEAQT